MSYAIYPSVLDAYLRFKRHDDDETLQSLLDRINKVETEKTEDQLKGIDFEKLVVDIIDGKEYRTLNGYYLTDNARFNIELIHAIANKLRFATKRQEYLEAEFDSPFGKIKLYGLADFSYTEMLADLKGTKSYGYLKYKDSSQHPCYSLIKKLNGKPIKEFKYVVSDYEKMFLETYIPSENMHNNLMADIFDFIRFLNIFRKHITDKKIFGL